MTQTLGLDVGGAHLKVALVADGGMQIVRQIVCPLWQGMDRLDAALAEISPLMADAERVAVTMTGELSDLFPDRKTGVETIVARLAAATGGKARYWMGHHGFGAARDACAQYREVGSTNFLATAALLGRRINNGVLIDFGSTTTDIIPIRGGAPVSRGLVDVERQANGELVYTGFTRTGVATVATRAPFRGQWVGLAREYLATMADVRRVLGELPDGVDLHATADGKDKTRAHSLARLARMLGCDAADGSDAAWRITATYIRECQMRSIHDGALQVLSVAALPDDAIVAAAGIGWRAVLALSQRLGRGCQPFADIAGITGVNAEAANHCAPAVAVALLLDRAAA